MSTAIFKWMPKLVEKYNKTTQYNTLVSEYENGMVQRRKRFGREVGNWAFSYDEGLLSGPSGNKIQDEILTFFKAREGKYDNFYLPSWEFEFTISDAIVAGTSTLYTLLNPLNLGFSVTAGDQGNFLYICNHYYVHNGDTSQSHEVQRIISSSYGGGKYSLTIDGTFDNSYNAGAKVMKAFKVYFADDDLQQKFKNPYMYGVDITFTEDIGDLY